MAMKNKLYDMSIRCHFGRDDYTQHRQSLTLKEIEKWVDAYQFTHPNVESFSFKIWVTDRPAKAGEVE